MKSCLVCSSRTMIRRFNPVIRCGFIACLESHCIPTRSLDWTNPKCVITMILPRSSTVHLPRLYLHRCTSALLMLLLLLPIATVTTMTAVPTNKKHPNLFNPSLLPIRKSRMLSFPSVSMILTMKIVCGCFKTTMLVLDKFKVGVLLVVPVQVMERATDLPRPTM